MKLAVMKLTSLLVLLVGVLPIALMFTEVPYADQVGNVLRNLAPTADAEIAITEKIVAIAVSVVLVILGFYGFIPSFARKKSGRQLIIKGADGDITLNLDSVQVSLARELTKMPEVHKAKLHIEPIKGGKKALVSADVEIEKLSGVSTRELANTISAALTRNAKEVLGLEDMVKVKLDIDGIHLDENQAHAATAATAATAAPRQPQEKAPRQESSAPDIAPSTPEQDAMTEEKVDAVSTSPASPAPIVAAESESKDNPYDLKKDDTAFTADETKTDSESDFGWRESSLSSEASTETSTTAADADSDAADEQKDEEDKPRSW